ncbi:uncharacterized protein LOC129808461 [Phlebotomus papatasi]|uniref:uncharacterized protein LOC129808461 n=1 Tax=Phlebotomus papatasi TaxID=29031 RepID=UPI002483A693|nr:uncharacterized protein LOC129808461 [Phlebotomus papatasi]
MPNKGYSKRNYKGQLTIVKNVIEKYHITPGKLNEQGAEVELLATRDTLERIEKKFQALQSEIINEAPPETKTKEQDELSAFLDECLEVEMTISTLLAKLTSKSSESTGLNISGELGESGNASIASLVSLMTQQMKEQRQQRISEEVKLKEILSAQREEFQRMLEISRSDSITNREEDGARHNSTAERRAKLEPIKLPMFSGSYADWHSFKNLFISSVGNDRTLSKSQKMHYLLTSTSGDAYGLFKNLEITDSNFDIAWERLVKRYEDKMMIITSHFERFLKQPQITKPDAVALRQLQASTTQCLEAIDALNVNERDPWLIHLTLKHLDSQTQEAWSEKQPDGVPTWKDFDDFLNKRCRQLESCPPTVPNQQQQSRNSHSIDSCNYQACKECSQKHNHLLHIAFSNEKSRSQSVAITTQQESTTNPLPLVLPRNSSSTGTSLSISGADGGVKTKVLFATAIVSLLGPDNISLKCRVVLDPASQINIITSRMCQCLSLKPRRSNLVVDGVGSISQASQHEVEIKMRYQRGLEFITESLDCIVMPKVVGDQPNWEVDLSQIPLPPNLKLADPSWHVSQKIDLLIGGAHVWQYFLNERQELGEGMPILQSSVFGWLVVGPCPEERGPTGACYITTLASIDRTIKRFWEIEEIPKETIIESEHREVEEQFRLTTHKNSEGRYVVQIPLKPNIEDLSDNKLIATRQLNYLLSRLPRHPRLFAEYDTIFKEYLSQGIIERVPLTELSNPSYYLPHHAVVKENAVSTKTRIVFNASSRTKTGLSFNDCIKACPVVQPTLISILWRFRLNEITLTCDIKQMYLQVALHSPHKDYHRFLWREGSEVIYYRFTRVCFGVAASPFLATRVLNKIAEDESQTYPLAASVLRHNFYVDDCLVSVSTVQEALTVKEQLTGILRTAGMELSKFRSNRPQILANNDHNADDSDLILDEESKTLGIIWNPREDEFKFRVAEDLQSTPVTKRNILSKIARIFDPCGLIAPVVTSAKVIMQVLWRKGLEWDDEVPECLDRQWKAFVGDLKNVDDLCIPRWICAVENPVKKELHAFSDASNLAYGAAVYLIYEDSNHRRCSGLVSAKSRLNPISSKDDHAQSLTIPKAELSGAELAVQLMSAVGESLGIQERYYWTDAKVVLYQIHSKAHRDVFVRNRVMKIRSFSTPSQWRHVPTKQNPADVLSRGCKVLNLISNSLWWHGPSWLQEDSSQWPPEFSPEEQPAPSVCTAVLDSRTDPNAIYNHLIEHCSSFIKATRVVAWVSRAATKFKQPRRRVTRSSANADESFPFLTVTELQVAEKFLIKWEQENHLKTTLEKIQSNRRNKVDRYLRTLYPFVDIDGILRVGGRIDSAHENYDAKFQIILPHGKLAEWIAEAEHVRLLHSGPQETLSSIRRRFWPVKGRSLVRRVVHKCVVCIRAKPKMSEQLMGSLPEYRVTLTRPFLHTGVDLTGHVLIKRAPRGSAQEKAYVCIFICMCTKAVHLEVLTSLSTKAFISAFRRFIARRGMPSHMHSDNGTNFVGASKELYQLLKEHATQQELSDLSSSLHIQWLFNPPLAPHQGGLWEAAVRSFKHHFVRVVGRAILTYEELNTVVIQIEAVLNSRPLVAVTDHPGDYKCLTPGDFLIGHAPTQLPIGPDDPEQIDTLRRWQLCTKLRNDFVRRWKVEYLHSLQQRHLWNQESPNIAIGDVVLLKSESAANVEWPMGLVESVLPGRDQKVRVVVVRVNGKSLKRPITKLVKLLIEEKQ